MTQEQLIKANGIYIEALGEVLSGVGINYLELVLKDFEKDELYEECCGLKKALDFVQSRTIKEIDKEYRQLIRKEDEY